MFSLFDKRLNIKASSYIRIFLRKFKKGINELSTLCCVNHFVKYLTHPTKLFGGTLRPKKLNRFRNIPGKQFDFTVNDRIIAGPEKNF